MWAGKGTTLGRLSSSEASPRTRQMCETRSYSFPRVWHALCELSFSMQPKSSGYNPRRLRVQRGRAQSRLRLTRTIKSCKPRGGRTNEWLSFNDTGSRAGAMAVGFLPYPGNHRSYALGEWQTIIGTHPREILRIYAHLAAVDIAGAGPNRALMTATPIPLDPQRVAMRPVPDAYWWWVGGVGTIYVFDGVNTTIVYPVLAGASCSPAIVRIAEGRL